MSYKLSPSSLNLFKECPRCFWLTQHKKFKRPDSIFPSLPSGMDHILKEHFDRFMEKGTLPPELCKNKDCDGLKLFDDTDKLKIWRSNFKGISYTDKNGNVLHGAIDNILVKNGKLIVLDYKTRGFPLKEDTHEHYIDQLNIYNFLLRKNNYDTLNYAYLLFYHPSIVLSNGNVVFNSDLIKIDIDTLKAEVLFNNAVKLLDTDCPDDGCEWCRHII